MAGDYTVAASGAAAVTPSDTVDMDRIARALYIGGSGDVKVNMVEGNTITFSSVMAGTILPVSCKRVFATGTNATLVIALY